MWHGCSRALHDEAFIPMGYAGRSFCDRQVSSYPILMRPVASCIFVWHCLLGQAVLVCRQSVAGEQRACYVAYAWATRLETHLRRSSLLVKRCLITSIGPSVAVAAWSAATVLVGLWEHSCCYRLHMGFVHCAALCSCIVLRDC